MTQNLMVTTSGSFLEAKFDAENVRINNVVLLGRDEGNNRIYTEDCRAKAVALYEGVQAFVDHPTTEEFKVGYRSVRNLAGEFRNSRLDESGRVRADFFGLPNENGKLFLTIAESGITKAGMSHNANGKWRQEGNKQIVEQLTGVFSVDLVANPATTKGMFESQQIDSQKQENTGMEWKDISIHSLRENRPDLIEIVQKEGAASRDDEMKQLIEERDELKKKADELAVLEAVRTKQETIAKLLTEAKLPDEAITDVFKESLMAAKNEAEISKLIEDRKNLLAAASSGGVRNMGGEAGGTFKEGHIDLDQAKAALLG